jgi:hypothetical protein
MLKKEYLGLKNDYNIAKEEKTDYRIANGKNEIKSELLCKYLGFLVLIVHTSLPLPLVLPLSPSPPCPPLVPLPPLVPSLPLSIRHWLVQ